MNPLDAADLQKISDPTSQLSADECTQIYQTSPALLEAREFVIRFAPQPADGQISSKRKSSLPTVSLQEIINSLLEENRVDEGVRFLNSIGPMAVLNNKKLVTNLLVMFKPTDVLEEDLKQRGSFLLQALEKSSTDTSKVWKVDNERRQSIIQAQHLILTYLVPVKHVFIGKWFDQRFSKCPEEFLDLLDELTTMPQRDAGEHTSSNDGDSDGDSGPDSTTSELELTMFQSRLEMACILLEQVSMDLARNIASAWGSVFMQIASEGSMSLDRVSYPARLLEAISTRFNAVLDNRHNPLEQKIASLLLDLVAIATSCGTVSRFECVQRIAKLLAEKDTDQQSLLIDLIRSDLLAVEIMDHLMTSWFRVDKKADMSAKRASSMPLGIEKTAFWLQYARPKGSRTGVAKWYDLVCGLSKLVQRSMQAFASRVCQPNAAAPNGSTLAIDQPPSMLVVNKQAAGVLAKALKELRQVVGSKFPLDDTESMAESDSDGECSGGQLACRMRCELDLMEAFLNGA
ncbi:hypothetical protein EC988_000162 [Linderina pennispora]|nr:hypothetical protein EC988_000162 [Linderina pennispora]